MKYKNNVPEWLLCAEQELVNVSNAGQIGKITLEGVQILFHVKGTQFAYRRTYKSAADATKAFYDMAGEKAPEADVIDEEDAKENADGSKSSGPRSLNDVKNQNENDAK